MGISMIRHKIILNPAAGKGKAAAQAYEVEQCLKKYNIDYDIDLTQHPWHASQMAMDAIRAGFDVLVPAGGDGTANEVINGIMQAHKEGLGDAAMGALPIGRGNDFSFSMGIPQDLDNACRILAEGYRRRIDIGFATGGLYPEGRYFGNGIGIGFDATVGFVAAEQQLDGFISYLVAAFKVLAFHYKAPMTQVELDDKTITLPAAEVSIMNGTRLGGGFMMAPQGDPSDSLFDLNLIHDMPRAKLLKVLMMIMKGTHGQSPAVQQLRSSKVMIKALDGHLPAHVDGETLCTDAKELKVELFPQAIELVTTKPA
jgi:diacylglycerol kinase (ATP)